MAINFPPNPTPNQTHTDAGRTWKWDGTSWRLEGNASNYTHPDHTGDVTSNADGATTIADDKVEEKHINAGGTAGANKVLVYDSNEATNWKWADQSGSGGGGLQNIVEDTTPQLGGNLDVNDKIIEFGDSSTANDNRLKLGSHDDIQLYHDGTTSILKEKKGQFHLLSEPNSGPGNIDVTSTTFNWISGSSTVVALTSNGITITGSLTAGGLTYPTTNGNANDVLTSNGSGGVSWSTPSVVSNLNDLTDVNAGSPGDGQVLKWQSSTSKWIAAADQTSTGGTGISLTDLSRTNATPNNPSKLEYDNSNGVFTYTPPDLTGYLQSESDTLDTVLGRGGSSPKVLTAGGDGSSSGVTLSDGEVSIRAGSGQQAKINLFCEVNNAHYVTVKAPPHSSFSGNVDFVLPANNGTNGYLLSTNGSGTTSWVAPPSGGVTDGDKGAIIVSQSGATWTLDAALTELSDVSVSSPSNGQVLKYNGTNWINDTDATGSTGPGGNHTQFQYNNNGSFAGNDLLLATNDTSYTGSGASLTLNGATGWNNGNVTWEPNIGCLALTRDSFLIFGSPDNAAYDMKASIGWASSVNRWIMNNPTDGMPWHFETRGEMVFKKQNSPETVHMTIDPDDGVEIKNQLDLTTATIIDKNGQAGSSGQILSSTATGIDWINAPGATSLDGLSDTNINTSNLANEQILQYNGSKWVNATVSLGGTDNYVNGGSWSSSNGQLTLNRSGGLSDVTISVSNLQSYFDTRYSTTTGASTLNDLNDTTIASPQTDQLLQWNGSKWVNATVSLGGTDTNNYVTNASWSSSTGQLTLTRGGTSSLSSVTANVSNLKTYLENNLNISGGIDPGTPNVSGATIRWNGSSWEWSRTALIDGGTSSNNTNLVVHNNTSGYGGMEIEANGQVLLKKAGTSYREGGHLQFEDHTFSNNQDTFAIDVYSDNGTFAECMIRIIDQYTGTQRFAVNHNGAWGIGHTNPDFGSTGEVMISRGSGQPPYWGNHANISGSSFATAAQGATADTANSEIDHIYSQLNAIGNDDSITTVAQLKTALLALVRN